jgi:hypothetical protein
MVMATITRVRRFERGLTDGMHRSTVSTRLRQGSVVFHSHCACGWESPDADDPTRAHDAFLHHLRRAGVRAG